MKTIKAIREILLRDKEFLARRFCVKNIGIFGSFARRQGRRQSDIDILVEFSRTPDIFQFVRLEAFLQKRLGRKVDLVTRKALKPAIKGEILEEMVSLW